jgi:hypothetical protein
LLRECEVADDFEGAQENSGGLDGDIFEQAH